MIVASVAMQMAGSVPANREPISAKAVEWKA